MKRALTFLLLAGCGGDHPGEAPLPCRTPVLDQALSRTRESCLPSIPALVLADWEEILEASALPGRIGKKAHQQLNSLEASRRESILLALVERKDLPTEIKRSAYSRLARDGGPAILPRLLLRLRYEKDAISSVAIARGLLRHGNGAGFEAIRNIVRNPFGIYMDAQDANEALLAELPPLPAEGPGATSWSRFLGLETAWENRLPLPTFPAPAIEGPLEAEVWAMASRLQSQPLRPVDEARFVLSRMGGEVIPILISLAEDEDHYLREHALQTLAWLGRGGGSWSRAHEFHLAEKLAVSLLDPSIRARALEALGATSPPGAEAAILPWLAGGNREERTAAADAILRCGSPAGIESARRALKVPGGFGPEGLYSLGLFLEALGEGPPPVPPEGLASEEQSRRDGWARSRTREVD
jgi:hypothetical protein